MVIYDADGIKLWLETAQGSRWLHFSADRPKPSAIRKMLSQARTLMRRHAPAYCLANDGRRAIKRLVEMSGARKAVSIIFRGWCDWAALHVECFGCVI